jgi:hypothetical protein
MTSALWMLPGLAITVLAATVFSDVVLLLLGLVMLFSGASIWWRAFRP